ncbi:MAG: hypothetical protein JWN46_1986 [Acidimicrobiales bacterium]|nr:hypothetical protein [Acidimicrobiales bacterium]
MEGLRYNEHTGAFALRNGFMTRAVVIAEANPGADFLLLLDEVNRSNVPKVLGDLLLTLEKSKRTRWDAAAGTWTSGSIVTLPYSARQFSVPDNIYVLGTMNTSDQSIAPLDAALRRRFAFVRVPPLGGAMLSERLAQARGPQVAALAAESIAMLTSVNKDVLRPALGPDGELGHSYLFDIASTNDPGLALALGAAQAGAERAFWTEVRSGNGGSRNQFDLAEHGVSGMGGSLELFYPLGPPDAPIGEPDPDRQRVDSFVVRYEGDRYTDNQILYNASPVWRIRLQGTTADGENLSAVANQIDGVADHPEAKHFEHRILIWSVAENGDLVLQRIDRSDARIAVLKALSAWHDRSVANASGRDFGLFDMPKLRASNASEPRLTWRYAILPQLVELAVSNGIEDLLDTTQRASWQATHGSPANGPALTQFDHFLAEMSIWLRVVGHDLGRTLVILDQAPPDIASATPDPAQAPLDPAEADVQDAAPDPQDPGHTPPDVGDAVAAPGDG